MLVDLPDSESKDHLRQQLDLSWIVTLAWAQLARECSKIQQLLDTYQP